ncbi:hypothetical protein [Janthinobacterium sp. 551a]|uniref:hypothetical protein n=1 Tax=Janthinobacterium sp. 551a TaxID=1566281 RepID=UPI001C312BB4|nr:hypothetical protein [Janthinobacterium sp. 551a]
MGGVLHLFARFFHFFTDGIRRFGHFLVCISSDLIHLGARIGSSAAHGGIGLGGGGLDVGFGLGGGGIDLLASVLSRTGSDVFLLLASGQRHDDHSGGAQRHQIFAYFHDYSLSLLSKDTDQFAIYTWIIFSSVR